LANHKSALKRIKQSEKRRLRNKAAMSKVKTLVKKFQTAVSSSDAQEAKQTLTSVVPAVGKSASKGIIHKNKAARIVSRLTRKLNAMAAQAPAPAPTPAKAKKAPAKNKKPKS